MKKLTLIKLGVLLLTIELITLITTAIIYPTFFVKLLSMISACHIGGRLAFIAVGLENNISVPFLTSIIIIHNTTYLMITYSLFKVFAKRIKGTNFFKSHIESIKEKAFNRKKLFNKWNRISLFLFVWLPLPWTGAVIGSYIAHLEGYSTKETLSTVLPAMWLGVISWSIWFDELYQFIDNFGRDKTLYVTASLLFAPIIFFLVEILRTKKKSNLLD